MIIIKGILLLGVIYLSFISLGLPDTVLGIAWPSMRLSLNLPLEAAGIFAMVTTLGTALSSFSSGWVLKKLGIGKVVFFSCILTAGALLGYSFSPSFLWLLLLTIPLGIGAGSVDTGLNNYVANNYSAMHMSWLHCFWGLGAFFGPNIMTFVLGNLGDWRKGYQVIGSLQFVIAFLLLVSLPLWKKSNNDNSESHHEKLTGLSLLRKKGVLLSILAFPIYVGVEAGIGLWFGSYLIEGLNFSQGRAGIIVSLFYLSLTIGRFLNGIISNKFSTKAIIRGGIFIMILGLSVLILPFKTMTTLGIIFAGLGCAPIFPSMIHQTPKLFGSSNSEEITGYQVGMAYLAGLLITPLIGLLANRLFIGIIPILYIFFTLLLLVITEKLNFVIEKREKHLCSMKI